MTDFILVVLVGVAFILGILVGRHLEQLPPVTEEDHDD